MGRKLEIILPEYCCGNRTAVGEIHECLSITHDYIECGGCGKVVEKTIVIIGNGIGVELSRIKWLPDEQDVLDHDERQELTA